MRDPILDRVEELRLAREMTMKDLERTAGITNYRGILRHGSCNLRTLRVLCDALGVEVTVTEKPGPHRTVPLRPCGTPSAARRHQARGEPMCEPCRRALWAWDAARKRTARGREPEPGDSSGMVA